MQDFHMYMCDICGFSREKFSICPHCDVPLTAYNKNSQAQYDIDMEEAMRSMSEYKWYI